MRYNCDFLCTQWCLREAVKKNYKIEKKINGTYLWDGDTVAKIIINNMIDEAYRPKGQYIGLAYFISYRLKFADEKTIQFMKDVIFRKQKHFTEKIHGKYTLYETMQIYNCDYYEAILIQYYKSEHFKNAGVKFSKHYMIPDCGWGNQPYRTKCSELSEDGQKIIFMKREDWEQKYGPVEVRYDMITGLDPSLKEWVDKQGEPIGPKSVTIYSSRPITEEERTLFFKKMEQQLNAIKREIKLYEKKFRKKEKKWTKSEEEEFNKHLKDLRKQGIDI